MIVKYRTTRGASRPVKNVVQWLHKRLVIGVSNDRQPLLIISLLGQLMHRQWAAGSLSATENYRRIISRTIAAETKKMRRCRAKLPRARQLTTEARSHRQTNHGAYSRSPDTRLHACWYAATTIATSKAEKSEVTIAADAREHPYVCTRRFFPTGA